MARRYTTRNANRALARIEDKARSRAEEIAEYIVSVIHVLAPEDPEHERNTGGVKLKDSYYVKQDPATGDFVICSRRRYWAYVEYGTRLHTPQERSPQPHVRPAIDQARARYG